MDGSFPSTPVPGTTGTGDPGHQARRAGLVGIGAVGSGVAGGDDGDCRRRPDSSGSSGQIGGHRGCPSRGTCRCHVGFDSFRRAPGCQPGLRRIGGVPAARAHRPSRTNRPSRRRRAGCEVLPGGAVHHSASPCRGSQGGNMIRIGTSQQSATGVSTRMMTGSWQHLRVPGSRGPRHRQRGAVSVEAVLLLPLVILIVSAATASWRVWQARADVQSASQSAARTAAMAHSSGQAVTAGAEAGSAELAGTRCRGASLHIAADTLSRRVGTRGSVSASVSCTVALSDLGLPLPGSIHVNGSAQAPVDSHRERTP